MKRNMKKEKIEKRVDLMKGEHTPVSLVAMVPGPVLRGAPPAAKKRNTAVRG